MTKATITTKKEIFHMAIISQDPYDEQCRSKSISRFAKEFRLARLLSQSNIRKAKGVGVLTVFMNLLAVAFSGKPLGKMLDDGEMGGAKDVYYRFMNSVSANWLKFVRLLSSALTARVMASCGGFGVLILDDTLHKRDRSKKVELLTRVRDHNDGRYHLGFRCLSLCFHLGSATIPVDFRLLSSRDEKTRINGIRSGLDKRTNGYRLRQYAVGNSFQMAFDMIGRQRGLVRHVLFDSWFAMPVMFRTLRGMGLHGVGMLKASKTLYRYKGKLYRLESLYALAKPLIPRENDSVTIGVELGDGTPFAITFVMDKRNRRNWLAIGTTDLSLPPQQAVSLYARRWNIEVFFKTVKSCLGFASECKSRSFDAMVCSVAVVFTRHMVLTWLNLALPAPETDGQLFFRLYEEMRACSFPEALEIVIGEAVARFVDFDDALNTSLRVFIASLPFYFKPLRLVS
jgi:IS4 transposase